MHCCVSTMDEDCVKRALIEAIKEGALRKLIRAEVRDALTEVREGVMEAVREAMAEKDALIEALRNELKETKEQMNDLEQYSRRLCLNVSGIPEGGPGEETIVSLSTRPSWPVSRSLHTRLTRRTASELQSRERIALSSCDSPPSR